MKEWKDGKNGYALYLNDMEVCVLYYDEEYGYYVRTYLDGGSCEEELPAGNLELAKSSAEKWYADRLRKSIEMHKQCIAAHEKKLEALEG